VLWLQAQQLAAQQAQQHQQLQQQQMVRQSYYCARGCDV
jgi:hypothetical protein